MAARTDASRIIVAGSARAAETELVTQVARAAPRRPQDLGLPVRIVVPSRGLRLHVGGLVARCVGRSLAGVTIQTLPGLAREVVERLGGRLPATEQLSRMIATRLTRNQATLAPMMVFSGWPKAVWATVRDLLDAGLGPEHAEPLADLFESLAESGVSAAAIARAGAIVRVAIELNEILASHGLIAGSGVLQEAADRLHQEGRDGLPSRAVLVYGFADATGVAGDLLAAILRVIGGVLIVARPDDPFDPAGERVASSFVDRFVDRFSAVAGRVEPRSGDDDSDPVLTWAEASQPDAEVRGVAERVRGLLQEGVAPERVAVVARQLAPFASLIRRHFRRLGIPFSGAGETVAAGGEGRRARGVVRLLELAEGAPADLWLSAYRRAGERSTAEIVLAARLVGAIRVSDLAALDLQQWTKGVDLGVGRGWDATIESPGARSRTVPSSALELETQRAAQYLELVHGWPEQAATGVHRDITLACVEAIDPSGGGGALGTVIDEACSCLPEGWSMDRGEWLALLSEIADEQAVEPIGGAGSGVQVLGLMEARAQSFEHLFVIGCNRGVLPRVVNEDPILSDRMRAALLPVLPELPVKGRGWLEERYLFEQLLASSPQVSLSWSQTRDGRKCSLSPFLEGVPHDATPLPALWDGLPWRTGPQPAYEHAVRAAMSGDRAALAPPLGAALTDAGLDRLGERAAKARCELVEARDPGTRTFDPSPFFGIVGRQLTSSQVPVTMLEDAASCPWRTFVTRVLMVRAAPDPLLDLPGPRPQLVGEVVHRALQSIVEVALGESIETLGRATTREPTFVLWPTEPALARHLRQAAERVARREGGQGLGTAVLLEARARPMLERAGERDWNAFGPQVLGAEVEGELRLEPLPLALSFRVDRVDEESTGLTHVDYKTGRPPFHDARTPETRRKRLLSSFRSGRTLQAMAYALAAGGRGRYLYVGQNIEDDAREVLVEPTDAELVSAFEGAVGALLDAWINGVFLPRVEKPDGNPADACRACPVKQACIRGDSQMRRHLVRWIDEGADDSSTPQRIAGCIWRLGEEPSS